MTEVKSTSILTNDGIAVYSGRHLRETVILLVGNIIPIDPQEPAVLQVRQSNDNKTITIPIDHFNDGVSDGISEALTSLGIYHSFIESVSGPDLQCVVYYSGIEPIDVVSKLEAFFNPRYQTFKTAYGVPFSNKLRKKLDKITASVTSHDRTYKQVTLDAVITTINEGDYPNTDKRLVESLKKDGVYYIEIRTIL